ncbi:MAG TPA: hypothetical protein VM163_05420 [bacterium]|nr:hypothetical protein [bacterium]
MEKANRKPATLSTLLDAETQEDYSLGRGASPELNPYRAIWFAVIGRAFHDARGEATITLDDVRASYGMGRSTVQKIRNETPEKYAVMYGRCKQAIIDSARDWIASDGGGEREFIWVCDELDIDPLEVRAALARYVDSDAG